MKVIAEQHALGASLADTGNGWGFREVLFPVRGERHHRLYCAHDLRHALQRRMRHEHWLRGKQVGASFAHQL